MNTKIFTFVLKNLQKAFNLPKYQGLDQKINQNTLVEELPWSPARFKKFTGIIESELEVSCPTNGSVESFVTQLDINYSRKFFSEVWQPRTGDYEYTGWSLVDEINAKNPRNVLDVGCGYHPFKDQIPNLVGIDPYNDNADFMVDILEYRTNELHDHIIALGSINFNDRSDVEKRFGHCVDLLAPNGLFYLRANPGIPHANGPYVDIFPWNFEVVKDFEAKWNLKLETFKRDKNNRLYFRYKKLF